MKDNVHGMHRERMRDRFILNGIDNMSPHEALELMLYYVIPRCDTNPLAHELIDTFGSFSGVLDASVEDLAAIKGVGKKTAVFLKLFLDVNRFYEVDKTSNMKTFTTIDDVGRFLRPRFLGRRDELVIMLSLDTKNSLIAQQVLFEGNVNSVGFDIRKMVGSALRLNAANIILAHNHPGGVAVPSMKDVQTTEHLRNVMSGVNLKLLDHLVFAGEEFVSICQSKIYKEEKAKNARVIAFSQEPSDYAESSDLL